MSALDLLADSRVQYRLWRSVSMVLGVCVFTLCVSQVYIFNRLQESESNTKIVLSPAISHYEVVRVGEIPDNYIKSAFEHIAHLNSSWTYESLEDNFNELFNFYYDLPLLEKVRAGIQTEGRYQYVRDHKMVSLFKVSHDQSSFTWCSKLKRACGIVTGVETLYINHNEPYRKRELSYLIFASAIYPTKTNPFSLKVNRVVAGDYKNLKKSLDAAIKGELLK